MLGRAAYQNPEVLLRVDPLLFGAAAPVADGLIVGSALVRKLAQSSEMSREELIESIAGMVGELASSLSIVQ